MRQYTARFGHSRVPLQHVEGGHQLVVWVSNVKVLDAKLTDGQRAALAKAELELP
ncbi:helicase associated domain-containing protein [Mangrovactinospora gilvigrisea]|uniref:helicase associated domain-containing protein n=1 Tax=Mangrovactinospora gilvigrisea TaxID=1428644 RepID=UPI003AF3A5F4